MNNLNKRKPKEADVCKTSKRERRRKFARFKDTLHHSFGNPQSHGIGEGTPNICEICKKRVHKTVGKYDSELQRIIYKCTKC